MFYIASAQAWPHGTNNSVHRAEPEMWRRQYTYVEPELNGIWINADVNVDALVAAVAAAGWVRFADTITPANQQIWWRTAGATCYPEHCSLTTAAREPGAGLLLHFGGGASVLVGIPALFEEFAIGGDAGFGEDYGYKSSRSSRKQNPTPVLCKIWCGPFGRPAADRVLRRRRQEPDIPG